MPNQVWSYCFHALFLIFSWTFLPSRSLSCLSPVVSISITFYFLSYILFYPWILPNLYPSFRPSLPRFLSRIVTTLGYFRILPHRPLWSTTTLITLGYYHIVYFLSAWCWVLLLIQCFASKHIRSKLYKFFILNFASFSVILYLFLAYTPCFLRKKCRAEP